jgi:hypothetical protein
MRVSGICMICGGVAEPAYSCYLCGVVVCKNCIDPDTGLCKRCSMKSG